MENMEKGVNPENDKPKLSGEEEAFKKLLESYDPKALEAYEEAGNEKVEVKGVQESPFESAIISEAKKLVENDEELKNMLSDEDRNLMEKIIEAKQGSGEWKFKLASLKSQDEIDGYIKNASFNLYKRTKEEILSKMGKGKTVH
ncbi:MAG: hypothetical protein WC993_11540 [Methanoculleus sp.]|nr:hypothetical protein [Candidatus Moranbacteria bacterium]